MTERLTDEMMEQSDADWERLAAELQQEIDRQAEAYFSARVLQEARRPQNLGQMPDADAQATVKGPCGDTMTFYLKLEGGWIRKVSFTTDGCGPSVACGSCLSSMVQGMQRAKAAALRPAALIAELDGLPEEHLHCAALAVNTLRKALGLAEAGEGEDR